MSHIFVTMSHYLSIIESADLTSKSTRTIHRLVQKILKGAFDNLEFSEPLIKQSKNKTIVLKAFLETHFDIKTPQTENEAPKTENESSLIEFLKKELEAKGKTIENFQKQFDNFQNLETEIIQLVTKITEEKNKLQLENQALKNKLENKMDYIQIESAEEVVQEKEIISPEAPQESFVKNPEVPKDRTKKLANLKKSKPADQTQKEFGDWFNSTEQ